MVLISTHSSLRRPPSFEIEPTSPEELAILHFTSGTTGRPKGAMHVHAAVIAHRATAIHALDLKPEDIYWCTADPGWVTGTSYGIIAPLVVGCTLILDEEEFDAERWYSTLEKHRVNVWYTAPTAIRMLIRAGDELPKRFDLSALRFIASVGEPLHPEAVVWGQQVLGRPIHDNWWQTETGGIMIANTASMKIKPGSMGLALPGIEAAIVRRKDDVGGGDCGEWCRGRTGAQARLALHVPRLSQRRRKVQEVFRWRLVPYGRYGHEGC